MDNNTQSDYNKGPELWKGKKSVWSALSPCGTRCVHFYRDDGPPNLFLTPVTCLSPSTRPLSYLLPRHSGSENGGRDLGEV